MKERVYLFDQIEGWCKPLTGAWFNAKAILDSPSDQVMDQNLVGFQVMMKWQIRGCIQFIVAPLNDIELLIIGGVWSEFDTERRENPRNAIATYNTLTQEVSDEQTINSKIEHNFNVYYQTKSGLSIVEN